MRGSWTVVLVVLVALGLGAQAQTEPPEKLTAEQRKELEAKGKELNAAAVQAHRKGQLAEATKAAREALAIARQLYPTAEYPDGHPDLATSLNNLGFLLWSQRKFPEAEPLFREALAMRQRLYARSDHPELARSLNNLGVLLRDQEKYAEAEPFYHAALAMERRLHAKADHPELATSLNNLGGLLQKQGKYAEAETFYRDALAMRRLFARSVHPVLVGILNIL